MEKDCDDTAGEDGGGKQYGDWLRATPVKWKPSAESRTRWLEGGHSGGSKQGRSWENWRPASSSGKKKSLAVPKEPKQQGERVAG